MDMTLWAQSRRDKAFKVALLLFLLSFSDYISEQLKVSLRYLLTLLFFYSSCTSEGRQSALMAMQRVNNMQGTTRHLGALVRNVS